MPRLHRGEIKGRHDTVLCKIVNLFGKRSSSKKFVRTLTELGFFKENSNRNVENGDASCGNFPSSMFRSLTSVVAEREIIVHNDAGRSVMHGKHV